MPPRYFSPTLPECFQILELPAISQPADAGWQKRLEAGWRCIEVPLGTFWLTPDRMWEITRGTWLK